MPIDRKKIRNQATNLERLEELEQMVYWLTTKVETKHPALMPIEIHGAWKNEGKFWPSHDTYVVILKDINAQIKLLEKELE